MNLLDEFVAEIEGFQIGGGGDLGAHFEARTNVFAVVGGVGGKPAGLLMVVGGFGPGDLIAGGFCFL